jgi:hypothetical protein
MTDTARERLMRSFIDRQPATATGLDPERRRRFDIPPSIHADGQRHRRSAQLQRARSDPTKFRCENGHRQCPSLSERTT